MFVRTREIVFPVAVAFLLVFEEVLVVITLFVLILLTLTVPLVAFAISVALVLELGFEDKIVTPVVVSIVVGVQFAMGHKQA